VPLVLGDEAALVVGLDGRDSLLVLGEDFLLRRRDDDVVLRDRDPGPRRVGEREALDRVEHGRDRVRPVAVDELGDEAIELPL
jgi:hypothetical protein